MIIKQQMFAHHLGVIRKFMQMDEGTGAVNHAVHLRASKSPDDRAVRQVSSVTEETCRGFLSRFTADVQDAIIGISPTRCGFSEADIRTGRLGRNWLYQYEYY